MAVCDVETLSRWHLFLQHTPRARDQNFTQEVAEVADGTQVRSAAFWAPCLIANGVTGHASSPGCPLGRGDTSIARKHWVNFGQFVLELFENFSPIYTLQLHLPQGTADRGQLTKTCHSKSVWVLGVQIRCCVVMWYGDLPWKWQRRHTLWKLGSLSGHYPRAASCFMWPCVCLSVHLSTESLYI